MSEIENSTNVRGAADNHNPQAVVGRDVVYFAHTNTDTSNYLIKKVASDYNLSFDIMSGLEL